MRVVADKAGIKALARKWMGGSRRVGFVPTMGALHAGHLSLVRRSRRENDLTVVSIYVNPLQFGPREDWRVYPRPLREDMRRLRSEGVDVLFTPSDRVMYPRGFATKVKVDGPLVSGLCGRYRPGHFDGVATVVVKLLDLVRPDVLYLGRKDAQQAAMLARVVQDLDLDVEVRVSPIVRERDGLAMSSRNARLTPRGRQAAAVLYRALSEGRRLALRGAVVRRILSAARRVLAGEKSVRVQYLEVVDRVTLVPLKRVSTRGMLAVAAFVDGVRLIDNLLLSDRLADR
jgi:pantoate--beta-alanine ligase